MVEDVWSRRIVGFDVHEEESMQASAALVRSTCAAEDVDPAGLVVHSDNGGPMKGSTMLATLRHLRTSAWSVSRSIRCTPTPASAT